jgi:hypothetical protein
VAAGQRSIRDAKGLGRCLDDHPASRTLPQKLLERRRRIPMLFEDRSILATNADLRFPSTKVDRNMFHG